MFKCSVTTLTCLAAACGALLSTQAAQAQSAEKVLNLYSARHYATDEALYSTFTKTTGIKINRVDSDDAGIITRLKAEGVASPADLILLVDAARLTKADDDACFNPSNLSCWTTAFPPICALQRPKRVSPGPASPPAPASSSTTRHACSATTWTPMKSWPTPRTRACCARARAHTPTT